MRVPAILRERYAWPQSLEAFAGLKRLVVVRLAEACRFVRADRRRLATDQLPGIKKATKKGVNYNRLLTPSAIALLCRCGGGVVVMFGLLGPAQRVGQSWQPAPLVGCDVGGGFVSAEWLGVSS